MQIRVGYELVYECPQPTPMLLMLNIHYTRASDLVVPDHLTTEPRLPIRSYRDSFGNWCARITAPARPHPPDQHRHPARHGASRPRRAGCAAT